MTTYKHHSAAKLFPMMSRAELLDLAADIKLHGQQHSIILTQDDLVLDGRNRLAACELAGVEPDFQYWLNEGETSPTAWVLSTNMKRRHLDESQRGLIAVEALKLFEAEAKERQKLGRPKKGSAPGRSVETPAKAATQAAASVGVGTRTVERAKAVVAKASKADIEQIREGKKTLKQVERELKRSEQVAQVKAYVPPTGEYPVISCDVAWPYDDDLEGSDAARGGLTYPAMTEEEIFALKVPAAEDCALFFWVTNTHLVSGLGPAVVKAWGFTAKTIITWDKVRIGTGRYVRNVTEHCIVAVKGKPLFNLTNEKTMIVEPRREHSRKPDSFYSMVEKLCPAAPRLEMFARASRDGWVTTGAELPKKTRSKDWVRKMPIRDLPGEANA
jgi:N6-adenosine-specific RNA methylase IME4/ParB-like chromosome segregation protein Spo0J